MSNSFLVLYLGQLSDMDTVEGDKISENASDLVGLEFGDAANPLVDSAGTWSPVGTPGDFYDTNNFIENNQFSINDGLPQTHDATATYHATITYTDGSTATITAVVAQDTNGHTYLLPEAAANADQAALEAGVIQSISLDAVESNEYDGAGSTRSTWNMVTCFAAGTRIRSERGEIPIECLAVGDRVMTQDRGLQPIRWIGRTRLRAVGKFAPVVFAPDTVGNTRPLRVSPQHRMCLQGPKVELLTGSSDALVPAIHMVNGRDITQCPTEDLTYFHLLFDQHELIWSEGCLSESFYPFGLGVQALAPETRDEVLSLFPEIQAMNASPPPLVRPALSRVEWSALRSS